MATADEVLEFIAVDGVRSQELARLLPFQRAVFACCCAQRLLDAKDAGGDHPLAQRAVRLAWDLALGDSTEDPEPVLDELEALGEELDQDALAASFYALATAARGGAETAAWAGQRGTDHAFELLDRSDRSYRPLEVDAIDPIVQREYLAQRSDLDRVSSAESSSSLAELRLH
ncbi:MAG: hypothetical protein CVT65_03995 [Actinobacteria bacterium HGW-Actinobacteria-5]|jgi:hypothetical protein|nr:MAG: hypothetical protein CVT65_03995 [Actinobacteria bacterium HGW-Actinobacteria-5]